MLHLFRESFLSETMCCRKKYWLVVVERDRGIYSFIATVEGSAVLTLTVPECL